MEVGWYCRTSCRKSSYRASSLARSGANPNIDKAADEADEAP
jgi:hypothetical protein